MKIYSYTSKATLLLAAIGFFAACEQEEVYNNAQPSSVATVSVTTTGFESNDPNSRVTDAGYTTTFTFGDSIGITVVDANGNIAQNNVIYIYDGSDFLPASTPVYIHAGATYVAYYPYSAAMSGKKTTEEIVNAFTPKADQSTYKNYAASDLMTATTQVAAGSQTLSFNLVHMLSLVEITLADQQYKVQNGGTIFTKPNTFTSLSVGSQTGLKPFYTADKVYRYITKPTTNATVIGRYMLATGRELTYDVQGSLNAGTYIRVNVTTTPVDANPVAIDVSINNPTPASGATWSYANGVYTLTGDITLIGTTTTNSVKVQNLTTANVTLDNVDIQLGTSVANHAFDVPFGASATLNLIGANILKTQNAASVALHVLTGGALTINSSSNDNSLTAASSATGRSAGIGGAASELNIGSRITILGGTVNAIGTDTGAGIGGGDNVGGCDITISGGIVSATGGTHSAGIGGGYGGNGGNVTISGGTVTATGCVAIGKGEGGIADAILSIPSTQYSWWHGDNAGNATLGTYAEIPNMQTYKYVKIVVN